MSQFVADEALMWGSVTIVWRSYWFKMLRFSNSRIICDGHNCYHACQWWYLILSHWSRVWYSINKKVKSKSKQTTILRVIASSFCIDTPSVAGSDEEILYRRYGVSRRGPPGCLAPPKNSNKKNERKGGTNKWSNNNQQVNYNYGLTIWDSKLLSGWNNKFVDVQLYMFLEFVRPWWSFVSSIPGGMHRNAENHKGIWGV